MSCSRSPTTAAASRRRTSTRSSSRSSRPRKSARAPGLGLSMVYGFAKQSGGAFRMQSELGQGTRAEIWLPRARDARRPAAGTQRPRPRRSKSQRALSILLVDDHDEVRTATAAMLEELGHTVIQAANGIEAVAALSDGAARCDLLISDYAMPKMSGIELIRQARLLRPGLPSLIDHRIRRRAMRSSAAKSRSRCCSSRSRSKNWRPRSIESAAGSSKRPSRAPGSGVVRFTLKEVEARAGIEPACKDLQSSA